MKRSCGLSFSFCLMAAFFAFLVLAAVPGAATAEQMKKHNTIDESHPRARLIVGSQGLHWKVRLIKPRVAPLGKMMRGQATVQNVTDKRLVLEYKIDWLDEEGFIIGDGGIWERFALGPRELRPFKSLGKSRHASKMQFTVRFPGDTFMK